MLTIFACPKPFTDPHIAIIQRNAITSWTLLRPKPEIILFGNESGVAEICKELSVSHVPEIARNEFGTPLLNAMFMKAQQLAKYDILCYSNSDIILMADFIEAVKRCSMLLRKKYWLLTGRRWLLTVPVDLLDFQDDWQEYLRHLVRHAGYLDKGDGTDFFVFPKGTFSHIPPFCLGRGWWHAWLIWYVIHKKRGDVIDGTEDVMAIHQSHPVRPPTYQVVQEYEINRQLSKGWVTYYGVEQANYALRDGILKKKNTKIRIYLEYWRRRLISWSRPLRHIWRKKRT